MCPELFKSVKKRIYVLKVDYTKRAFDIYVAITHDILFRKIIQSAFDLVRYYLL